MIRKTSAQHYSRRFFEQQTVGATQSAKVIVPLVLEIFPARSVVDVGCGTGAWLKEFSAGGVNRVVGVDGAYVARDQLVIEDASFIGHDLERPLPPVGTFDLAISLEVAEHLSPARADSFVSDLCKLADVVLFSAAIPFQRGDNHINEQWQSFWAAKFVNDGFDIFDVVRSRIWHDSNDCAWYYKQNTLFYVRRDSVASQHFWDRFSPNAGFVDIVHPNLYSSKAARLYSRGFYRRISNPFRPYVTQTLVALRNQASAIPSPSRFELPGSMETKDR